MVVASTTTGVHHKDYEHRLPMITKDYRNADGQQGATSTLLQLQTQQTPERGPRKIIKSTQDLKQRTTPNAEFNKLRVDSVDSSLFRKAKTVYSLKPIPAFKTAERYCGKQIADT